MKLLPLITLLSHLELHRAAYFPLKIILIIHKTNMVQLNCSNHSKSRQPPTEGVKLHQFIILRQRRP